MDDVLVGAPGGWHWTCSAWQELNIDIIDARRRRFEMVVSPAPAVLLTLDMLAFDDSESLWQVSFTGIDAMSMATFPEAAPSAEEIAGDLRDTLALEGHYQLLVEQFDISIDSDVAPRVARLT